MGAGRWRWIQATMSRRRLGIAASCLEAWLAPTGLNCLRKAGQFSEVVATLFAGRHLFGCCAGRVHRGDFYVDGKGPWGAGGVREGRF